MEVRITPSEVHGRVSAPQSKSYTHRAILAAGHAGAGTVCNPLASADTAATIRAAELFGADITRGDGELTVEAPAGWPLTPPNVVDCGNSGTTFRLMTATAALAGGTTVLTGDGSLRTRPQGQLLQAITELGGRGTSTRGNGQAPVIVSGPIRGGSVGMVGETSQFISALLMAGARTDAGIDMTLPSPPNEEPYIHLTIDLLDAFGVDAAKTDAGFAVGGGQQYGRDSPYEVPPDFSSMSYLLAAGAVAGEVTVTGVRPSVQGDQRIVDLLGEMGADVRWDRDAGEITVGRRPLTGIEVDIADVPDLLPTIAALGAVADGTTRIRNCGHVRHKETDRVDLMREALSEMGAVVSDTPETLVVRGGESSLTGAILPNTADHRLVMALSVVALAADGITTIPDAAHVDISFPGFFDCLAQLGATFTQE